MKAMKMDQKLLITRNIHVRLSLIVLESLIMFIVQLFKWSFERDFFSIGAVLST